MTEYKRLFNNYRKSGMLLDKDIKSFYLHENITEKFNAVLKEKDIDIEKLANQISKLSPYGNDGKIDLLQKITKGERCPSLKTLIEIAEALEVSIYELGYPQNNLEAYNAFSEWLTLYDSEDDEIPVLKENDNGIFEFDEASYFYHKITERLQKAPIDRHTTISRFPAAYLAIDDNSIELLLRFQKFNQEDRRYLHRCVLELHKSNMKKVCKSKTYKQLHDFMSNENFSDCEKYNSDKANNSIREFIDKSDFSEFSKLYENIDIYASLDMDCFSLLADFIIIDSEIRKEMAIRIADQMHIVIQSETEK